ncbi:MAG: Malate-2H(+)/Na(+)-lactate antiporter [Firmicutes bacterium]|nr:Malate-2H(+)/Na(+)-lactate antiporter [Bacillota bacterium]
MVSKKRIEATILHALIPIIGVVASLSYAILVHEAAPHIPLIFGSIIAAVVAVTMLGIPWEELEQGIKDTLSSTLQAILILMIVGTLIGLWILSGTIPAMIYYGLQILSPGVFLAATFVICCIVSLATGTSWGTAGTVGIALTGIGIGLGMPAGMVAGAVVSGAYFGDKLSPLSDTTNLAPAMAGSSLFAHIKHMLYTSIPAFVISLVLYVILGLRFAGRELDAERINVILDALRTNFAISPWLLIPPVIVILLIAFKVPALPGLIGGSVAGGLFAAIFQSASVGAIITAAHYGFEIDSGVAVVDRLLNRGGLDGMMWTVALIICALVFGGMLEKTGMLRAIGVKLFAMAKSNGSLVLNTIISCIATNILAADQYLSIVLPGRLFKDEYARRGLAPKNLSRALEGGGTVTSALIPWNTCGAFMMVTLGVSPLAYLPYAFLNLLLPVINVVYGYLGFSMAKLADE